MSGEGFRQDFLGFLLGNAQDSSVRLPEDIAKVMQHQVFLGDAIRMFLIDEHTHCRNNHLYADRGFEQEGFVADKADIRCLLAEAFDELLGHCIGADEDSYLAEFKPGCLKAPYPVCHIREGGILFLI